MDTLLIRGDKLDLVEALDTAYSGSNWQPLIDLIKEEVKFCEDCEQFFGKDDGRYYKYAVSFDTWLCDGCHDERMEEE